MEETPDTVITLINGKKIIVQEDRLEVKEKIIEFRKKAFSTTIIPFMNNEDETQ